MNPNYFSIMQKGLYGELEALELPSILRHLDNHLGNFLLEPSTISAYLNRLLETMSDGRATAEGLGALRRLLAKYEALDPLEPQILDLAAKLLPRPDLEKRARILAGTGKDPTAWQRASQAVQRLDFEAALPRLNALLDANPHDVLAAGTLLMLDLFQGRPPRERLREFAPPKPLADQWNRTLFLHYAALSDAAAALPLFETLPAAEKNEVVLNAAAELFVKVGRPDTAQDLYRLSLARDPSQAPVGLRLAELAHPRVPDPGLVGSKKVNVYLYSYNKAALLADTLASLAASDIGPARVSLLLNGCSDDSRAAAEAARSLFPEADYEVVDLPVNVGAPAARNWLINRQRTWEADYTAFLDDDVLAQKDWLAHFLTAMEADPKAAVVGCKILDPGEPARYQYLYRTISVAENDLLKLSLARPARQFDVGSYDFVRETVSVMGCQHLFRTQALRDVPLFDIRFSPSQVDDIDHDLELRLRGWRVLYCGLVGCVHRQSSGLSARTLNDDLAFGNAVGNDVKLFYKRRAQFDRLRELRNPPASREAPFPGTS